MMDTIVAGVILVFICSFTAYALWFGAFCILLHLYELQHFRVDENGKLTTHPVWWGKYLGLS